MQYTYDAQGRVIKETYEDGQSVSYAYNRNGKLARTVDSKTGISTTYFYDSINRPSGHRAYAPGSDHIVQFAYDKNNNVTYMTEITNDVSKYFSYTYDNDNRITSMNADGITVNYTYDSLGRVTRQMTKNGNTVILTKNTAYATSPSGKATGQVSSYYGYTYTYDGTGIILSVSDGTYTTSYVYDSQNQLIRENNGQLQKTYTWTYDAGGNITCRKEYAYTTGSLGSATVIYNNSYGNSEWGDLLTSYNGKTITYDSIGNPLTYDGWTFNWKHGRQLSSMSKGTTTWTYTYGANGMRTSRSNGTTTYQYYYTGDQLTVMTKGSTKLSFTHDAAGNPLTLTYNGTKYYYNTNLQGDVIGILDSSGTTVVTYIYDAWGRPYSTTGSLASTLGADNPLRYRGYVYDTETGLYYLQSRYNNPEWGRFINADAFITTGQGFAGNNMFAYCNNNPVNYVDSSGKYSYSFASDYAGWIGQLFGEWLYEIITTDEDEKDVNGLPTVNATTKKVFNSVVRNTEISIGIGMGFEGEATVLDVAGVTAGMHGNIAQLEYCDGQWSSTKEMYVGATITVFGNEYGAADSYVFSKETNSFVQSSWLWSNPNIDSITLLGASAYFIAGGSFRIGFDLNSFLYDIDQAFSSYR